MIFNRSNSLKVLLLKEGKRCINKTCHFEKLSASLNCLKDFPNAVYKVNAVKLSSKSYNKMAARVVVSIVIDFQYHKKYYNIHAVVTRICN